MEGRRLAAVPVGLVEQGEEEEEQPAPSPVSAEGWACFPENTDPGSDGRYLRDNGTIMIITVITR